MSALKQHLKHVSLALIECKNTIDTWVITHPDVEGDPKLKADIQTMMGQLQALADKNDEFITGNSV